MPPRDILLRAMTAARAEGAGASTQTARELLDLKSSSYHFHRQLEPFSAFLRREWKTAATCSGLFSLAMVAGIMLVDPAFFYPRLQTDPLNYLLKAKALVETGSTTAHWAVNMEPFAYVSMPGVLRAPMMLMFSEFDHQLRAIQLLNIPIVVAAALLSAYMLSWVVNPARHWLGIVFAFAFTLLSPVWAYNIFLPMADAPYAVSTMGAMLVAIEVLCSPKPIIRRPGLVAAFLVLFVVSFLLRFTAPVLLVFGAVLAAARWQETGSSQRLRWAVGGTAVIMLAALVLLNITPIFGRYFLEPYQFVLQADKPGMIVNLIGASVPAQVIPSFQLGFVTPPIVGQFRTSFTTSLPNMAWAMLGILISATIAAGMWISRRRLLPEILYLLAALPVLTLMMPSTARYLMSYQALFWIFFYVGAVEALRRAAPGILPVLRSRRAVIAGIAAASAVVVGLRSWRVAGTASAQYWAVSANEIGRYVTDVSGTFRSLRDFIETLPPERTLLVSPWGMLGRWQVISNRSYYFPDSAIGTAVRNKDVYLIVECGTREPCQSWKDYRERNEKRVLEYGKFAFDSVFAVRSPGAWAEVFRIRQAD